MDLSSILQLLPGIPSPLRLALMGDGRPDNSPGDVAALAKAFAAEHAKNQAAKAAVAPQAPTSPTWPPPAGVAPPISGPQDHEAGMNAPIQPTQPMPPVQGLDLPMAPHVPLPVARPPQATPAPAASAVPNGTIPLPAPRPQSAPSGQPMGFFAGNTAMMRDPISGDFIDPVAAQNAQANISGPALVQKFMNLLHKEST